MALACPLCRFVKQLFPTNADVIHLFVNHLGGQGRWLDCLEVVDEKLKVGTTRPLLAMLHFLRAQALVQIVKHQYALVHPDVGPRTLCTASQWGHYAVRLC
jgi:hypothetical protein